MDETSQSSSHRRTSDVAGSQQTSWLATTDGDRIVEAVMGRVHEVEQRLAVARRVDPAVLDRPFTI
jgi:hypothetical protein